LYFGYLLATAAPVAATPNRWLAVSFALCAMMLAVRAVQEERRLRAQLGAQYDDYCKDVKRLVPFVW
jgi:protein-S-isoprenylcysteine O-methyltransferase Ste14